MIYTDNFTEQATQRELYALQQQIDELRRMATANNILATAQQKRLDLQSLRLDKMLGYIKCQ